MSPQEITAETRRQLGRAFDSDEAWAEFICCRERLGLTFSFQTAQECIDEFMRWWWFHSQDAETDRHNEEPCDRCGLTWRSCGCPLNDFDRAYNT